MYYKISKMTQRTLFALAIILIPANAALAENCQNENMTIVITSGGKRTISCTPFYRIINKHIYSSSGELRIFLSPYEYVEYQKGKLVKYSFIKTNDTEQVAEFSQPIPCIIGSSTNGDVFELYESSTGDNSITKLHGKSCKIVFSSESNSYSIITENVPLE